MKDYRNKVSSDNQRECICSCCKVAGESCEDRATNCTANEKESRCPACDGKGVRKPIRKKG